MARPGDERRRDWGRLLVVTSLALVLGAALFALFGPTGVEESQPAAEVGEPEGEVERRRTTMWGQIRAGEEDERVILLLAFPVLVALVALALEWTRARRVSRMVAALLLAGFAVVTGFSVGPYFLPGAAAMLAALLALPPMVGRPRPEP